MYALTIKRGDELILSFNINLNIVNASFEVVGREEFRKAQVIKCIHLLGKVKKLMQQCYIQIKNIIQKQFKYRKGFQIEYFINMVVVFLTCAHTLAHSE